MWHTGLPHEASQCTDVRCLLSALPRYPGGIAQGYPGNVQAVVTYVLEDGSAKQDKGYLRVLMEATTDQAGRVAHGSQMHEHTRLLAILR